MQTDLPDPLGPQLLSAFECPKPQARGGGMELSVDDEKPGAQGNILILFIGSWSFFHYLYLSCYFNFDIATKTIF